MSWQSPVRTTKTLSLPQRRGVHRPWDYQRIKRPSFVSTFHWYYIRHFDLLIPWMFWGRRWPTVLDHCKVLCPLVGSIFHLFRISLNLNRIRHPEWIHSRETLERRLVWEDRLWSQNPDQTLVRDFFSTFSSFSCCVSSNCCLSSFFLCRKISCLLFDLVTV